MDRGIMLRNENPNDHRAARNREECDEVPADAMLAPD